MCSSACEVGQRPVCGCTSVLHKWPILYLLFGQLALHVLCLPGAAALLLESDLSAASIEAPWNSAEQREYGLNQSEHPGLGCSPLPEFKYPEDRTAGLGSQAEARPQYER